MAIIEITKIQIRRGAEADLLPTSLDTGEFGMTTDTGRLFLGTDPDDTGLWSTRVPGVLTSEGIAPYGNIEILTEASIDTFARMYDRMHRITGPAGLSEGDLTRKPYLKSTLAPNTSAWDAVLVERIDPATGLYDGVPEEVVLADTVSVGAIVQYFLYEGTDLVRSGTLTINHDGNSINDEAQSVDEAVSRCEISSSISAVPASQAFLTGVRFRAFRLTSGPSSRIRLEYRNSTTTPLVLQLRLMVAAQFPAP